MQKAFAIIVLLCCAALMGRANEAPQAWGNDVDTNAMERVLLDSTNKEAVLNCTTIMNPPMGIAPSQLDVIGNKEEEMQEGITIPHAIALLVTALLSGLVATGITLFWQGVAAAKKRKYEIFVDLMSSRFKLDAEKVVYALNMIDVVFNDDNAVRKAYEQFCDEANRPEDGKNSAEDKFLKLLEEIAKVLKLKNITWDKIKKQYYPTALAEMYELGRIALKKQASDNR